MANIEMDTLMRRQNENGDIEVHYPITRAANVLELDEKIQEVSNSEQTQEKLGGILEEVENLKEKLDEKMSSRAPAETALSNKIWTDERAEYLDEKVTSRAPANTALSNKTWTDERAERLENLDKAVSELATQQSVDKIVSSMSNFTSDRFAVFTSDDIFVVPKGITKLKITACSAGANGGTGLTGASENDTNAYYYAGGGGGGGGANGYGCGGGGGGAGGTFATSTFGSGGASGGSGGSGWCSGGGAGGMTNLMTFTAGGRGGASGQYVYKGFFSVVPESSLEITVGTGDTIISNVLPELKLVKGGGNMTNYAIVPHVIGVGSAGKASVAGGGSGITIASRGYGEDGGFQGVGPYDGSSVGLECSENNTLGFGYGGGGGGGANTKTGLAGGTTFFAKGGAGGESKIAGGPALGGEGGEGGPGIVIIEW